MLHIPTGAAVADMPHCLLLSCAGIPIDGKTVFTSDHALKLEWLPQWIAIIGSGYIGLEFSDVYTALGCEVTFIEVGVAKLLGLSRPGLFCQGQAVVVEEEINANTAAGAGCATTTDVGAVPVWQAVTGRG